MGNEIEVYEAKQATAVATRGGNYVVASPLTGIETQLKRNVDFGIIPGTRKPSLLKSGAERICMAYGLMQRYSIESKIEEFDEKKAFFHYLVKCELVKINPMNGQEYVFCSAYGSANTSESRNGNKSAANSANSTVKQAQKRALVAAALSVSGLSQMFAQDMDNEEFMGGAKELVSTLDEDAPVTSKQIQRLYALANMAGYSANEAKTILAAGGYTSTKDIKQKDYEKVCGWFDKEKGE